MSPTFPPLFVKVPPDVVDAEGLDESMIMTFERILKLSWDFSYRHTEAMTPEQLQQVLKRNRTTLYRHLKEMRALGWIEVIHHGKYKISIRILLHIPMENVDGSSSLPVAPIPSAGNGQPNDVLRQLLIEARIIGKAQKQILDLNVDPLVVRAWLLWAEEESQQGEWEPGTGYIVTRLLAGDEPLPEYLKMAQAGITSMADARARNEPEAEDREPTPRPGRPWPERPELDICGRSSAELWSNVLGELQLRMMRATFDTWLRGSWIAEFEAGRGQNGKDRFVVRVRHAYGVDWVANRLNPTIVEALERMHGHPVEVAYVSDSFQAQGHDLATGA